MKASNRIRLLSAAFGVILCLMNCHNGLALNVWDAENDVSINIPVETIDGIEYFQLSILSDALDTEMNWDFVSGTFSIHFKDHIAETALFLNEIVIDKKVIEIDASPRYINHKFFVPVSMLSVLLNQFYENLFVWDSTNQTIRKVYSSSSGLHPAESQKKNKIVIALDAGHGGSDNGINLASGAQEAKTSLILAEKLSKILINRLGVDVLMTRSGNYNPSFIDRVVKANSLQADLFVSIHMANNWELSPNQFKIYIPQNDKITDLQMASGFDLWISRPSELVNETLDLAAVFGKAVSEAAGGAEWGIEKERLYIFDGLVMPGMVIEFSDNASFYGDIPIDINPGTDRAVEALYDGVKAIVQRWK